MLDHLKKLYKLNSIYAVIGVANTLLFIFYVGVSERTDIWFASLAIITTFSKIFMVGFINEIFLPRLVRSWGRSVQYAEHLLSNIFIAVGALGFFSVALIILFSSPLTNLLYSSISVEGREEIAFIMKCAAPLLIFILMNELMSMVLNSRELYTYPEKARIFSSILNFIIILFLFSRINIWALYVASIVSHSFNFVILGAVILKNKIKISFQFRLKTWRNAKFKNSITSASFYVLITQIYSVAFRSYLSTFPPGMITVFQYVETIIIKGRSLVMRPLANVALTDFSKPIKLQSGKPVWKFLFGYFSALSVIFFSLGVLIRYFGIYVLLHLLDTSEYSQLIWFRSLLAFFVIMIPFEIILVVGRKKIVSVGLFRIFYYYSGITQALVAAIILSAIYFNIISLYTIYLVVSVDVFSKILGVIVLLANTNNITLGTLRKLIKRDGG